MLASANICQSFGGAAFMLNYLAHESVEPGLSSRAAKTVLCSCVKSWLGTRGSESFGCQVPRNVSFKQLVARSSAGVSDVSLWVILVVLGSAVASRVASRPNCSDHAYVPCIRTRTKWCFF